jgi:hypothetical protein
MPDIPPDLIRRHLGRADAALTSQEKGRALEDLMCELFASIPGVSIARRNLVSPFGTEELDIVLWNQALPDGLFFLGPMIVVECKHWSEPADGQVISYFVERIAQVGLNDGLLISSMGITGGAKPPTRAHHHISAALPRGICILVVTRAELDALTTIRQFIELLQEKRLQLVVLRTQEL